MVTDLNNATIFNHYNPVSFLHSRQSMCNHNSGSSFHCYLKRLLQFLQWQKKQFGQAGGVPSGTEAYYSFDYANIHFISLDSHDSDRALTGAMMTWLKADLAALQTSSDIQALRAQVVARQSEYETAAKALSAARTNYPRKK